MSVTILWTLCWKNFVFQPLFSLKRCVFLLELTCEGGVQMCNETWMVSEVRERVERRKV